MHRWAFSIRVVTAVFAARPTTLGGSKAGVTLAILAGSQLLTGCSHRAGNAVEVDRTGWAAPTVIVVAPVINLSDSSDWDPIKVTDIVAQEFSARPNTAVVPVNLALASLARRGKSGVQSATDARELASEFGADATVVTAVTAFQPYDPPIVGLVMQWYAATSRRPEEGSGDAGIKNESTSDETAPPAGGSLPRFQVQRVFNAADHETRAEIKRFAERRDGLEGPYGWQVVCKSQEQFMRYCSWAAIRSITRAADLAAAIPDSSGTGR